MNPRCSRGKRSGNFDARLRRAARAAVLRARRRDEGHCLHRHGTACGVATETAGNRPGERDAHPRPCRRSAAGLRRRARRGRHRLRRAQRLRLRADPRERNAETLCLKLQDLDRIDDALEYRHQGKPLDLLQVRVGTRAAAAD